MMTIGILIGLFIGGGLVCLIGYISFRASDWEREQEQYRKRRENFHTQLLLDIAEGKTYAPQREWGATYRDGDETTQAERIAKERLKKVVRYWVNPTPRGPIADGMHQISEEDRAQVDQIIYVVTHGEYDDYRIDGVWTDRSVADAWCEERNKKTRLEHPPYPYGWDRQAYLKQFYYSNYRVEEWPLDIDWEE